ncbi:hypothetical protein P692DRAFT_2081319, partial [Suillus brevipes Sb2]
TSSSRHHHPARSAHYGCCTWSHTTCPSLSIPLHSAMLRVCPIPEWAIIPHPWSVFSSRSSYS